MSEPELDAGYWDNRYQENETGWDIGYPSPPITQYIDQLDNPDLKILIPGSGNGYEAEYLWEAGFDNVHVLDYSDEALTGFRNRVPDFPEQNIHVEDFFSHSGTYDLIIEQTFFCALAPSLRPKYVTKMKELLAPDGKLIGVLFNDPLFEDHPPFGGNPLQYLGYFQPHFDHVYMKPCYNSIEPRMGRELFVMFS